MTRLGEFDVLCRNVPSYALCNLFYIRLQREAPTLLGPESQRPFAPIGINPKCGIYKAHSKSGMNTIENRNGSGNVVNNVVCAIGLLVIGWLICRCHKRIAAVGRVEFRALLVTYLVTLLLQLFTVGAFLEQGTMILGILTSIHIGLVISLFWLVLWNSVTMLQIWRDGTSLSLSIMHIVQLAFFIVPMLISLNTAFGFTNTFGPRSEDLNLESLGKLESIPLFVLTSIWPAIAGVLSLFVFCYVSLCVLREKKPFWIYIPAGIVFIVGEAFRLGPVGTSICQSSGRIVDASFIGTLFETITFGLMYYAWIDITKSTWEDPEPKLEHRISPFILMPHEWRWD